MGLCPAGERRSMLPRTADVVMLDGKHVIEAVVDLQNKKILSWTPIKGAHGMVLLDDFVSVQNIINTSSEFAEVLKKARYYRSWQSGHHPAHRWLF